MNRRYALCTLLAFVTVSCVALVARAADEKVDVNGTWKWTLTTPNGDEINLSAKLKQEGDKVTGTYYGRNNSESPIKGGKLTGNELKFTVVRDINGNQITINYSGKVEGDKITGKSEFKAGDNEEPRKMDWNAKREKTDSKKE